MKKGLPLYIAALLLLNLMSCDNLRILSREEYVEARGELEIHTIVVKGEESVLSPGDNEYFIHTIYENGHNIRRIGTVTSVGFHQKCNSVIKLQPSVSKDTYFAVIWADYALDDTKERIFIFYDQFNREIGEISVNDELLRDITILPTFSPGVAYTRFYFDGSIVAASSQFVEP